MAIIEPRPTNTASTVVKATAAATRYGWSRNDRTSAILAFDEQGEVIYVSPQGRDLLGRSPGASTHESIVRRIVVDDEAEALHQALLTVAGGGTAEATVTLHLDDGQGGNPVVEVTARDLRADPSVRGLIATVTQRN